jgi:hypothetical protein
MARTFLRQDTQVRSSDVYNDAIVVNEANFETNPANIEDDLNNQRSMLHHLLKVQTGNWWDQISTPSTLEAGAQRGVDGLNDALHLMEKKRVLRCTWNLTDVAVPASAAASETLTNATNFLDTETVTIDGKVYTFQTTLTNVDGNVQIGASVALSHENLRRAINLDGVAGTNYAAAMTLHPTVSATDTATTTVVTAKTAGTAGNAIAVSEGTATGSWGAATLSGGAGDVVILGTGELPAQTTAAVGAVTTLGTVVAAHGGTFGEHALDEVSGTTAISPKNLLTIVDGATRDPILSSGRQVYGLLQGESGVTDGATITDTTTTRVQISFVRINATGDDLELAPSTDIGGESINYCSVERVRLEDLNEGDFLGGANVDVPAGSTVTRQVGYDNQGVTPVELTTNADLDLAAGVEWAIRDLTNADLFRIIEGSGGGTTEINIHSGVDLYDNDAVDVDFASGATINSGGTRPIDVGVQDGIIESTAGDLEVQAAVELLFDDVNQTGSTWAQDGIKLSETTAEWDAFEVEFGEVSLLNAIVQASNQGGIVKVCANVTSTTVADTDVSLGDGNLDASLGDLSGGSFVDDHDIYLNGALLRSGADASANNDVYPGTSLVAGQLKFEFPVKINDVICVISRA